MLLAGCLVRRRHDGYRSGRDRDIEQGHRQRDRPRIQNQVPRSGHHGDGRLALLRGPVREEHDDGQGPQLGLLTSDAELLTVPSSKIRTFGP